MENTLSLQFAYVVSYLLLTTMTTAWVGHVLFKNGALFLLEAFPGKQALAESVNRLLLVGFYLINFGWLGLTLERRGDMPDGVSVIEKVAQDYGKVLLILGIMHFFNVYVLNAFRRRSQMDRANVPVAPEAYLIPKGG